MDGTVRDLREVIREEMLMSDKIIKILKAGPKTIPEIAGALERPSDEVMLWVMGMRKYEKVAIKEITDEGYYKYTAVSDKQD